MKFLQILAQLVVGIAIQEIKKGHEDYSDTTKFCSNPLPGIQRMLQGVDITKLDLKHDYSVDNVDGFSDTILQLSCSEGKTWTSPFSGLRYDVPDQVNAVLALPSGIAYSETRLDKNLDSVRSSMSAEAGIDSVTEGLFSASLSFRHAQSTLLNTSRYSATLKAFASTTQIELIPSRGLQNVSSSINPYALEAIQDLPDKYTDNPQKYQDVITTYGTHYYSTGYFGGTLMIDLEIDKSYYKATSDSDVKAQAQASFFGLLKAHGAYDGNVSEVSEAFKKASTSTQRYYGGVANLFDKEGYTKWWPTVASNPWLYGGKLAMISDLLPPGVKKQSLIQAVEVYLLKAYIRELQRTAGSFMDKGYDGEEKVTEFLQETETLLNSSTPSKPDAIALGQKITEYVLTPDWFPKVTYCVFWQNPYKGFTNLQCAQMLSPTPSWYMCDGDYAVKDCFRNIQFQFPPSHFAPMWWTNNVTATSNYDPTVGWSTAFTFRVPPILAPGWLLNAELCFYETSWENYRISLHTTPTAHCARANQWTPNYVYNKHVVANFNFLSIN